MSKRGTRVFDVWFTIPDRDKPLRWRRLATNKETARKSAEEALQREYAGYQIVEVKDVTWML